MDKANDSNQTMMVWKEGSLPGAAAFIEICPSLKFGMIALANSASNDNTSTSPMVASLQHSVRKIMENIIPIAN